MSSLDDAITYPTESDDWILTVLLGGLLSILSFLVVPAVLVYGYLLRTIRSNLAGEPAPPTFGDWGELFVDGLRVFVVLLAYMLVPLVVGIVTVGGSIAALATGSDAGAAAGIGGLLVGGLVAFVLALAFGYLAVVGLVNLAREGDLGAAFDFGTIRSVAFDADFAVPWLASMGVFFAVGVVGAIPLIGLVAVFLNFYAAIVAAKLWADGFSEAADSGGGRAGIDETVV